MGKLEGEIMFYLPRIYSFGAESEIEEILRRKCEKIPFPIEILIKKAHSVFAIFNSFHFCFKRAEICLHVFSPAVPVANPAWDLDDLSFFYKVKSIYAKNFRNFHPISKSPTLSRPFFSFLDKFLNFLVEFIGDFSGFIGPFKNNQIF